MDFIAIKMLFGDKLKYFGLILGVASAAMLITQQAAILTGLTKQTGAFIRDTAQADLWVMDPQVRFSQDFLPLRDTVLQQVRGVEGDAQRQLYATSELRLQSERDSLASLIALYKAVGGGWSAADGPGANRVSLIAF